MDKNEFLTWVGAVEEHINCLDRIIEDRKLLKKMIVNHLEQFFKWSDIDFNRDFSVITLTVYEDMIVNPENLSDLMMHWEIQSYDYNCFRIVVYPFGVPNDEVES